MLTRLARWQLGIFAVITVLSIGITAVFYLHLPAVLGIGVYTVTAHFPASGGLYTKANVTYRGTTIGQVTSVSLNHHRGVDTRMQLSNGTAVPENVTAFVKSVSAVGEQYVDLVPSPDPASAVLHNGSQIDISHTALSQDVAGLLREAENLVNSIDSSRLRDLLHETFIAFDGSGPELARLIESARLLIDEASAHSTETTELIDKTGPFLDTQIRSGDAIKSLADGLARLTGDVRRADPQLHTLLQTGPDVADQASTAFQGIRPSFPVLAANLADFGRTGVIYHKSIEQVLVIFPALTAVLLSIAQQEPPDEGAKTDFKLSLGDPPPCEVGFIPPPLIRTPADQTLRDIPNDLYCKAPQNDPTAVRGARNYPCQEFPGKRAPTVQLCRDPRGYVPIGSNPWRGPPIPPGTPIDDPRMILPMNKYPYIPPQADYDPAPPVVHLPPGTESGPGPALTPPFPTQVPPVTQGPPPPPLPYTPPPDQRVPPYDQLPPGASAPGPSPPAESPRPEAATPRIDAPAARSTPRVPQHPPAATYDAKSGKFLDSNGDIGVFASGASELRPAENWVELMMDPRPE
ncbi:MCE family protein [Mycobacterium sp. E2479]|uniref:MCE family protein n=1 Tax=Mycobacterium sp. E2479 TaxID=1834134 RepID=UPI0008010558|nr:MCE family protein [Mycobacterium sp. E2479]OBH49265.1 mammalian cell entry protein [Mycobacterium sp. E2479]